MRNSNSLAVLLLGIVVGCAAGATGRGLIVPPARAGTTPQRWEYACAKIGSSEQAEMAANALGQQGWELAAGGGGGYVLFCFKRPLP
jgi:hypothetical protein